MAPASLILFYLKVPPKKLDYGNLDETSGYGLPSKERMFGEPELFLDILSAPV